MHKPIGTSQRHQHPLVFVAIFLVFALLALVIATIASSGSDDSAPAGAPPSTVGFECPRGEPDGFALSDVEGKSLSEVEQWAAGQDKTVRVIAVDGEPMAVTSDLRIDRINVQVDDGVVTRYCGTG